MPYSALLRPGYRSRIGALAHLYRIEDNEEIHRAPRGILLPNRIFRVLEGVLYHRLVSDDNTYV